MRTFSYRLIIALLTLAICQSAILAQTTGSVTGTVIDQTGAVVPNATVVVKGESGQEFTATTKENGTYSIPAVATGTYVVTITAGGFKKSVTNNVKVNVGTPSAVDAALEVGSVEQVVEILGGGEVLQTQSPTVGTTIIGRQITETPLTSRDALDLVTLLPGTAQVGRPRQSTINGLPKGSLSITIDGVETQDQTLRSSDGFQTYVRPRLDAIEEVTVSTAAAGAESGGDGAVQIKFVTKRGTNNYAGGLFWQHRDQGLNSNYWWNNRNGLSRNPIVLNQYGGNFGGPLPFPNFGEGGPIWNSGKDKAFFFVNHEQFRLPESINRQRLILTPEAQNGIFRYGGRSVNLLQLAANNGFTSALDPTVASALGSIRSAVSGTGKVSPTSNPNQQFFDFIARGGQKRYFTAVRLDFNITKNHSLENIYNNQKFLNVVDFLNGADPSFPGFPNFGAQNSDRFSNSTALRSTITNNIVNEARFALLGGLLSFFEDSTPATYQNQGGFNLNLNGATGISNITAVTAPNNRDFPVYDFTDNLTWIAGNHSLSFGGQFKQVRQNLDTFAQLVTQIGFGIDSSESALSNIFSTANFPGATDADLAAARGLYALVTGRVNAYNGAAVLNGQGQYEYLGRSIQKSKQNVYGLYAQDSWRIKPNLTVNFGLRWQPQEPFVTGTSNFSAASSYADVFGVSGEGNLFKPGTLAGKVPTFRIVDAGYRPYETDFNNFAPSAGFVYSPNFGDNSFLKKIFGQQNQSVLRAGYSMSFVREGGNVLLSIIGGNPGGALSTNRTVANATLSAGTLLRNIGSVTPLPFPSTPPATITGGVNDSTNVFNPNLKTGYVHSWSVGYQRELDKNTVFEIRYVANRGRDMWRQYNINEFNVTENGFTDEFKRAQANLAANNAAGGPRAGSYAYFGAGSGTSPLPILQAYFNGAGNPNEVAQYNSALYRNATFINLLNANNPGLVAFAQNLDNSAGRRANALASGLPINFFQVNPTTRGGSFIVDNSNETAYDSMQIELRRRLSNGLLIQGNYTFAKALTNYFASSATVFANFSSLRDRGLNYTASPFDVRHSFKVNAIYELPFGKGKTFFGNSNRLADALVGGWSLIPVLRIQSGTPINFGNVNLVGMTRKELQKAVSVYYSQTLQYGANSPTNASASYLPKDIIENSTNAFNNRAFSGRAIVPATFGGCIQQYSGQCGFSNLVVYGPRFVRMDLSLSKKIRFDEKRNVELRAAAYNALNNPQWRVGGWAADVVNVSGLAADQRLGGTSFGQFTNNTVYQDTSTTNDQGGRTIELILRINF